MATADRLIEIFHEAKSRPAGSERDVFVEDACQGDRELKEQVSSLLRADGSAGDFLVAGPEFSPEFEAELARSKPEETGEQIGPYKLREQIGEGGFGVVWVAEQEKPVRRLVALKIIKLGMDTREVVARFDQERQALAMMDHPNIAKVFDAGATVHGRPYFVMELVRGLKITEYCDQAKLSTAKRLELFIQVCHAVQHAHQKGIIHRDLKPSNILVTSHDGMPVLKVIDFGVAKATEGRLSDLSIYTRFQQMIGTPLYMSPEQAEMSGLDVDTRADIYASGVLLYELLTGHAPFDAQTLAKAGYDEMRRMIREQEPKKPSTALDTMAQEKLTAVAHHRSSEPPKLVHAIRGDLDWIVMKCLEKDRTRRYETASALATDIQRHLANEPVNARPPSAGYRFRKLVRRNKLAVSAASAVAAALIIGFTVAIRMYFRESAARERATQAEKLATDHLAQVSAERDAKELARADAEAVSAFMTQVFQSPAPGRDGRTITVAETLDKAAKKLEKDLADQPARRARLQITLGGTYFSLGLQRQAIPLQQKVLDYHRTASGPENPETLQAMASLAMSYQFENRLGDAIALREEEVRLRRKVSGVENRGTLWAMTWLADNYTHMDRHADALKLGEEAVTLSRKVLGPEHPQTLFTVVSLAFSNSESGRAEEAIKLCEEALPLSRKVLGPEHPDTLRIMHDVGRYYWQAGRRDDALRLSEEVLPIRLKVLGSEHYDTLWTMQALASAYLWAGRLNEALTLLEELVQARKKMSGAHTSPTLLAVSSLADAYLRTGRFEDALSSLAYATQTFDGQQYALKCAALQLWFGKEADYEAARRRFLTWESAASAKPEYAIGLARIACLRPMTDASMQKTSLALAQRAVELGQGHRDLAYFRMTQGVAEYRYGDLDVADRTLAAVILDAAQNFNIRNAASFYRAMIFFNRGQATEARELFAETEARMKPLPGDGTNPLTGANVDTLTLWLAYKEAKDLFSADSAKQR